MSNNPTPGDDLVERLRMQARVESEAMRGMMEAKSLRQPDNPEGRTDLYHWPQPEETLPWKAADEIERLRTRDEAARSSTDEEVRRLREVLAAVRACRLGPARGESIPGAYEVCESWSVSGLTALLPTIDAALQSKGTPSHGG